MLWFRWVASVAIFICSAGIALAEEEKEEEISIACWEGSYLTGFTGYAGYVIDRMSIVCARWNPDRGRLDKPVYTTPGLIGRSNGGDAIDEQCPRGWAVAGGYSYDYARHDGGEVLHHFDFNCRPVGGEGGPQPLRFGSRSNAEIVFRPNSRRQCADGELATGIKARHGDFILEWQLICARPPSVILLPKQSGSGRDILRDRGAPMTRKGGGVIVGDPGPVNTPPPPESTPPVVKFATTKAPVDVLELPDGKKYGGDGDFLPAGIGFPVIEERPGWCKLKVNFPFVPGGEGWVTATFLEGCG